MDPLTLVGVVPGVRVVCGRCGAVLDRLRVDLDRDLVFYAGPFGGRRRRLRRPAALAEARGRHGLLGDCMRYRCRCGLKAERDFDEIREAALRVARAGRPRVMLGRDL